MPVAITAVQQDAYPPRVLVSVTGLTIGDVVTIFRSVGGQRVAVRAAEDVTMADSSLVRADAELPFGVPVTYVARVNDTTDHSTSATTYTLPGGKVAVSDAVTGQAAEVVITAWPTKRRERVSSAFVVGGRNVVVSGALAPAETEVELFTEAESTRATLAALFESATSGTVQFRQAGGYTDVDGYYAVTSVGVERWSQDGSDERRRWLLVATEVEPWPAALEARGFTYADVAAAYTGLTYANLAADFATYLAVAQGDYAP